MTVADTNGTAASDLNIAGTATGNSINGAYEKTLTVTANTLTLSATDVGAAIDLISSGAFSFALDDSQTFALTGNLVFPATSGVVYETAS